MRVELRHIHKTFGPVHANDDLSVAFDGGRIYGLLGENGAGKTTLMKILSGYNAPDSGQIVLDGRPVRLSAPADALRYGVGMLHQDPLDFPPFSVLDNFLLGRQGGLSQQRALARREMETLAGQFAFSFDAEAPAGSLTVGERQQLEIVRLLSLGVQVLILDEPTTGISAPQKTRLFAALNTLAQQGKTVIFVSHKLEDVEELCLHVTVLRKGKVVGDIDCPYDLNHLVSLMFGQAPAPTTRRQARPGDTVLELDGFAAVERTLHLANVNLHVRAGEVIGIAGMEGSGQRLLLRGCAGLLAPAAGHIRLHGMQMTGLAYPSFRAAGVAYLPASRLEEGLAPGLSLTEHVLLAAERAPFLIDWRAAREQTAQRISEFHIVGRPNSAVESLSGGNQQRALLALLPPRLRLLLMEHPTRGLDIESSRWIWERLLERRREGTAILFTSADLDEILERSDRILVFSGGRVTQAIEAASTSAQQLGELIGGKGV